VLLPGTNSPVCSVRCAGDLVRQAKTWDELVAAVQAELGAVREARVALRLVRRKDLILRAKMPGLVFPRPAYGGIDSGAAGSSGCQFPATPPLTAFHGPEADRYYNKLYLYHRRTLYPVLTHLLFLKLWLPTSGFDLIQTGSKGKPT